MTIPELVNPARKDRVAATPNGSTPKAPARLRWVGAVTVQRFRGGLQESSSKIVDGVAGLVRPGAAP